MNFQFLVFVSFLVLLYSVSIALYVVVCSFARSLAGDLLIAHFCKTLWLCGRFMETLRCSLLQESVALWLGQGWSPEAERRSGFVLSSIYAVGFFSWFTSTRWVYRYRWILLNLEMISSECWHVRKQPAVRKNPNRSVRRTIEIKCARKESPSHRSSHSNPN